ncbi:phage tail protein [Psychrobacter pacificensis]|uniref:phage tail fiber protein n=1 Tax=Psychrobacter pacificensis TaxID=112002 RepID=UPI003D05784A
MAIQLPNPGTGNGATGDNEWVMWNKVKDNFSDPTHAASRYVGKEPKNLLEFGAFGLGVPSFFSNANTEVPMQNELRRFDGNLTGLNAPTIGVSFSWAFAGAGRMVSAISSSHTGDTFYTHKWRTAEQATTNIIYTTGNTTTDSNGFIKAASPIVKVFADKVELNDDATAQDVTFVRNDIGDYTITTVSGLSTDGWYIELPKDINGNPKLAVTLTEVDGVISLKCYKRVFSMTTFTFEPDLDEPLDVPDGRWIDLRLNEIAADEPIEPVE